MSPDVAHAHGGRVKVMALAVDEFLRRFLLLVVPDRFARVRNRPVNRIFTPVP